MEFKDFLFNSVIKETITAYRISKDTGLNQVGIRRWITGSRLPDLDSCKKLGEYYGYDYRDLYLMVNIFKNKEPIRTHLLNTMVIK